MRINRIGFRTAETIRFPIQIGVKRIYDIGVEAFVKEKSEQVEGDNLVWDVSFTFNAIGERTMTFKASDGTKESAGYDVGFAVVETMPVEPEVIEATAPEYVLVKTPQNFTVTTSSSTTKLTMYREGGYKVTSWNAATNSRVTLELKANRSIQQEALQLLKHPILQMGPR